MVSEGFSFSHSLAIEIEGLLCDIVIIKVKF